MKSKRHYKTRVGDIFFIPYNRDITLDEKENYYPKEKDTGIIVQVIQVDDILGLTLAFFQGELTFSEATSMNSFDGLVSSEVAGIYNSTYYGATKGWWVFLGNYQVSPYMPYQAYSQLQDVVTNLERTIEKPSKQFKKIRFLKGDKFGTPGISAEIGRAINGLETEWEIDTTEYKPNPDAVLWKIFPEHYKNPHK